MKLYNVIDLIRSGALRNRTTVVEPLPNGGRRRRRWNRRYRRKKYRPSTSLRVKMMNFEVEELPGLVKGQREFFYRGNCLNKD
jgi:hypothetical protein